MIVENDIGFNLVRILLITGCTLGMMFSLAEVRFSVRRTSWILTVYMLWVALSSTLILILWGYATFSWSFLFTIFAPAVIIVYSLTKQSPSQAIFNFFSQIAFSLLITASTTLLNTALHAEPLTDLLLRLVLYAVVIALECHFFRCPFLRLTKLLLHGWGLLALIPVVFCILLVIFGTYPNHFMASPSNAVYLYSLSLAMVIIYFSVFQSLITQCRVQILLHDEDLLRLQISALESKMEAHISAEEFIRTERHNLRHRLQAIAVMIKKGQGDAALEFIGTSQHYLDTSTSPHWCDNPTLDAIFTFYLGQAKTCNIQLEISLDIPNQLSFDVTELSIVFANALENAIHACMKLPAAQRKIIFKCISKPRFMFEISNTCPDGVILDADDLPVASEQNHGIGTHSMVSFAKKHNAFYNFSIIDNCFTLRVSL